MNKRTRREKHGTCKALVGEYQHVVLVHGLGKKYQHKEPVKNLSAKRNLRGASQSNCRKKVPVPVKVGAVSNTQTQGPRQSTVRPTCQKHSTYWADSQQIRGRGAFASQHLALWS